MDNVEAGQNVYIPTPEEEEWIKTGDDSENCSCGVGKCSMCCPCVDCQEIRRESLVEYNKEQQ